MLFGHDGSRAFALQTVEQQGLVLAELELGFQVGAALIAVIARITHSKETSITIYDVLEVV
jgi:hypothetical protein